MKTKTKNIITIIVVIVTIIVMVIVITHLANEYTEAVSGKYICK